MADAVVDDAVERIDDTFLGSVRAHVDDNLLADDRVVLTNMKESRFATNVLRPLIVLSGNSVAPTVFDGTYPYVARAVHQLGERLGIGVARRIEGAMADALFDRDPDGVRAAWLQFTATFAAHTIGEVLAHQPEVSGQTNRYRRTLRDHATETIRAAIVDGTLVPGEALPEASLLRWLGMSRTPVRDATDTLAAEGLIELQHAHSMRVAHIDPKIGTDTLAVLAALRGVAADGALEKHPAHLHSIAVRAVQGLRQAGAPTSSRWSASSCAISTSSDPTRSSWRSPGGSRRAPAST